MQTRISHIVCAVPFRKRRDDGSQRVPSYSDWESSEGLPTEVQSREQSDDHHAQQRELRQQYLVPPLRPADDAPLFVTFIREGPGKPGVVTINLPDSVAPCLPVFTSPYRAADYRQVHLGAISGLSYLSCSAVGFLNMLRDLERGTIGSFAIDPCPRCGTFTALGVTGVVTRADALEIWAIHRAIQQARYDLYVSEAESLLRNADVRTARCVLLETAAHVTFEEPQVHQLLGQIAQRLDDATLAREAADFLRYLSSTSQN
jgi:hypothetical protein